MNANVCIPASIKYRTMASPQQQEERTANLPAVAREPFAMSRIAGNCGTRIGRQSLSPVYRLRLLPSCRGGAPKRPASQSDPPAQANPPGVIPRPPSSWSPGVARTLALRILDQQAPCVQHERISPMMTLFRATAPGRLAGGVGAGPVYGELDDDAAVADHGGAVVGPVRVLPRDPAVVVDERVHRAGQ
jgi:hypothetical protein